MQRITTMHRAFTLTLGLAAASTFAQAETAPAPDNSEHNKVVNETTNETADQQKNDDAAVTATRDVRKAIVADKSLSTYAHNVKIITQGNTVVLKGPVRSQSEKDKVEALATKAVSSSTKVLSELEISPK